MKIKVYDTINQKEVEVDVNAKSAHFIFKNDESLRAQRQEEFERSCLSLDDLMERGFQPTDNRSLDVEMERREKERQYLESAEYRKFRKSLCREIVKVMDQMSECVRNAMFLRFFKDLSISKIAEILNCDKSTARNNIARGCGYIKYFLDRDIKEQDKLERLKKMELEQKKYSRRLNKKNNSKK